MKSIKEETKFSGVFKKSVYQRLLWAYSVNFYKFTLGLFLGILSRVIGLCSIYTVGLWVDELIKNRELSQSINNNFLIALCLLFVAGFTLNLFFRKLVSQAGVVASARLHDSLLERVLHFPLQFFDLTPSGRVLSRFSSDYISIVKVAGGPFVFFIGLLFDTILSIIFLFLGGIYNVIFAVIFCVLCYLVYKHNGRKIRETRRELSRLRGPTLGHLTETVESVEAIKTYSKDEVFLRRFDEHLTNMLETQKKLSFNMFVYSFHLVLLSCFFWISIAFCGLTLISYQFISIGSFLASLTYVAILSTSLAELFDRLTAVQEAFTSTERIDEYCNLPIEVVETTKNLDTNKLQLTNGLPLNLYNVTLRYNDEATPALSNISFTLNTGTCLGVIGRTGSGKSSLVKAIFYLYQLEKGDISLGEFYPATTWSQREGTLSLQSYRNLISFLPQQPTLLTGSLRKNLDPYNKFSDEILKNTLEKVNLRFPLDFKIAEFGDNLSAGERQLICLARCLLVKTPLIIMDEATSNIDIDSEKLLANAWYTSLSNQTRIIIAHRLETLYKCDYILWLEKGTIKMYDKAQYVLKEYANLQENLL
jgi:ABC-type multidrug transport system fused ATPase/permease subunit